MAYGLTLFADALAAGSEARDVWHLFLQTPPLHPILVNLTAGLIPAAVLFDVVGRVSKRQSLISAGFWMTLLAGLVTPFTALFGWLWMNDMGHGGAAMTYHKWFGVTLAVLMVGLASWRWIEHRRATSGAPHTGPRVAYLASAVLLVCAVAAQGHLGGMMSFGETGSHDDHVEQASEQPSESDVWQRGISIDDAAEASEHGDEHVH